MKMDTTPEGSRNVVAIWLKYCGHLTDEQFEAAKKMHIESPEGRFSISPQLILAARARIAEEEKVIASMLRGR
jgi:hypothetical protein